MKLERLQVCLQLSDHLPACVSRSPQSITFLSAKLNQRSFAEDSVKPDVIMYAAVAHSEVESQNYL